MNNAKNKRHNFYHRGEIKPEEEGYSAYFDEWAERDLIAMLERDKNHPSIFQWSIGNEIEWSCPRYPASTGYWDENRKPVASMWDEPPITPEESRARFAKIDPVSVELVDTAKNLAQLVRKVDTTRPIIANMVNPSVSHHSGFADVLDVAGYSYRQPIYDYARRYYPTVPIMGTENFAQWHEWKAVIDRPFVAGLFLWTGIDYLGEAEMQWPRKGSPVGLLDLAGFTKPSYHMMKSLWSDEPHIFATTRELKNSIYVMQDGVVLEKEPGQWQKRTWAWHRVSEHWNYEPGETIVVEVYTNAEEVELFLDEESFGVRRLADTADRVLKWAVPFRTGRLEARSTLNGSTSSYAISTTTEPVAVQLTADKAVLKADGYDVVHVVAQLVDASGNAVKTHEAVLEFEIDDNLRVLGVDNGWSLNVDPHKSNLINTHNGRALLIAQSNIGSGGLSTIRAKSDGIQAASVLIEFE